MYETYSMLLNSRRSTHKEDEHASLQNQKCIAAVVKKGEPSKVDAALQMRRDKKLSWIGYIVQSSKDTFFLNLRMYDAPPNLCADKIEADQKGTSNAGFSIKQVREHDLLVLSEKEIDLKGGGDIKRASNVDFLRSLLLKHNAMLAYVSKKASKCDFVVLQVDISKSFFFDNLESRSMHTMMYCYHFENLSTTVREYKTLKMSEFYGMAPLLLNPTLALQNKDEMLQVHRRELQLALGI